MCEEIQTLLGQLSQLDHYSALGLDSGTSAADIKKAYFKAAKKYKASNGADRFRLGRFDTGLRKPEALITALALRLAWPSA